LPIALGILAASGQLKPPEGSTVLGRCEFYGELALNGEIKSVPGMLLAAANANSAQHELIVPREDLDEASTGNRNVVRGARHLREVFEHVQGSEVLPAHSGSLGGEQVPPLSHLDLLDMRGQLQAKRALIVAA